MSSLQSTRPVSVHDADDLPVGMIIGSWRIDRELGRGGMGTVYAVCHVDIGKAAALKVVHADMLGGDYDAEAFLTEARVVNAFSHPNVVDIFEAGTLPDGRPYLIMERLKGRTLGDRHGESRVPALEVIDHLIPLCGALAAAHAAGIVHRDIKLDNVFLAEGRGAGSNGRGTTVKLLDWGVASMAGSAGSGDALTIGTPRYVAPEQVKGEGVTWAADIYALGVMSYELFLEEPPFTATTTAELLLAHVNDAPPLPHDVWPRIPTALEQLLLSMLSKRPTDRPTAARVAAVLAEVKDQICARQSTSIGPGVTRLQGVVAGPRKPGEPSVPFEPARPRSWKWLAVAALIASVFGVRELVQSRHTSVATAEAEMTRGADGEVLVPVAATPTPTPTPTPTATLAHEPAADLGLPRSTTTAPAVVTPATNGGAGPRWSTRSTRSTGHRSTAAARPSTRAPTRQPPPHRIHPDSLIAPY